jgi:hypothetical protein
MYGKNIFKRVCEQFLIGLQLPTLRRDSSPAHNLKATTTASTQHMIHGTVNHPTQFQNVTPECDK